MTYVPIVPPTPTSPRTRELADQLARVMAEFEQTHPSVTRAEKRQAARLALEATRSSDAGPVAVVLGLIVLLILGLLYFFTRG